MSPSRNHNTGLREKLKQHQGATGAVCIVLLLLSAGAIALSLGPPDDQPAATQAPAYYFDLNTGETFISPLSHEPPVVAPSGPMPSGAKAGVRAHVFACGACENDLWVGYLSATKPPEDGQRMETGGMMTGSNIIIGSDDGKTWYEAGTPEANALVNVQPCAEGELRVECTPTPEEGIFIPEKTES